MVEQATEIKAEWLDAATSVAVTAGASAPEVLVTKVVARMKELGASTVVNLDGKQENTSFPLPASL